jgi:hypothetical protein
MKPHLIDSLVSSVRVVSTAAVALFIGGAALAHAQLLAYEGFNYPGTALAGQSGGTGWGANAWSDADGDTPLASDGLSLAFPALVSFTPEGGRVAFTVSGEAERRLGTPMALNVEGSTYYVSALVKRQGNFKIDFIDNGTNIRWHFGATNAADALAGVTTPAVVPNIFPADETVFIVAKMLTHASVNDQVYMNIYRSGDVVPGTEPSSWQVSASGGSGVTLTRIQIANLSDAPAEIDEIRIGTNWVDVAGPNLSGPPVISQQPAPMTVYEGMDAQFSVDAIGETPLTYQWSKDGQALPNATNAVLTLSAVTPDQQGAYTVGVTNALGGAVSTPVQLTVIPVTDISVGLQGQWHFDETSGLTAFDSTPNQNHGALFNYVGDDSQWVPSDYGNALAFNRALSNYVDVPHAASLGANLANRFSVAAWIRSSVPLSVNGNTYRVLEKENTFFFLQGDGNTNNVGSGGMNFLVKKGGANLTASIGQALNANQWYHLAGTFDGAMLRVYLDGELKGTRAVAAPIDTTTLPLRIGSDYQAASAGSRFDGLIDEVGIWERPLSESEIRQLAGQSGPPTILAQPQPQTKYEGGTAMFSIRARGEPTLRYLWFHGTNEIRTAVSNVLVLFNVQLDQAGEYRCRVSNNLDELFSDAVTLTVTEVTSINDGITAQWKFDDGTGLVAADSSGQGRDGQLVDFPGDNSQWIAGQVGGALAFDGLANRVVAANSGSLVLETDATIAFWINPRSYGTVVDHGNYLSENSRVLHKGGHFYVEVVDDPGTVRATIRANGISPAQYILNLNEWQHFAVKYQGGTISFFKNGFLLADPVPATLGATNAQPVILGNISDTLVQTNLFDGVMDEVGIWLRPLDDTEILTLAGRDVAGAPVIVTQPQSQTRYAGGTASFMVEAIGKRPLTYEWRHGTEVIPDSNTNRLVLTNVTVADAGGYTVTVQNDLGSQVSTPPAVLTVQEITDVTTGIIAYWPMDETSGTVLGDASGRGHDATIQNGTATGVSGLIGGAFDFDGVDDFAIVPHADDLNLYNQLTISAWISPRTFGVAGSGGYGRILRKDVNYDFIVFDGTDTLRFIGINKANYDAPANSLTTNEWQQVAVVVKDGTVQLFRNGRALADPVPGGLGPAITNDLIIANFGPDLSINRIFNGLIDDLGIWDRALSAAEVDGIYQNGLLGKPLNAPFEPLEIRDVGLPAPDQVRLVFFSPYTGRDHAIERKDQLDAVEWTAEPTVTFISLGGGLTEAIFTRSGSDAAFYRVALLPQAALFSEDFETGAPGWTHGGFGDNWELGTPVNGPGAAFSGTNVYATSLTGNIEAFSDNYLHTPVINLATVTRATLTFQEWRNVDPDPTFHGTVVSVVDPTTLNVLLQLSVAAGATVGYEPRTLPLPPQVLGRNVIIEFRLYCDGFNLLEGWYIDDVQILPE